VNSEGSDTPDIDDRDIELASLRAEVAQLQADLVASNKMLTSVTKGIAAYAARGDRDLRNNRVSQIGSRERMAMLEHTVDVLDCVAQDVAADDCCGWEDECKDDPCRRCRARAALDAVKAWRYGGSVDEPARRFDSAMACRLTNGWNPRETKIHKAWASFMGDYRHADYTLGRILTDRTHGQLESAVDWPSARDWYVATSVVQWLATSVGMSIIEAAGFKYTQWDEDRKTVDAKRAEQACSL
jgi:hypothetical protein